MTQTLARIKQSGKNFEIIVDLDNALKFKKDEVSSIDAEGDKIFSDSKKGQIASSSDLKKAFGTEDINMITEKIIKNGEVLLTQEHRDEEHERKFKQVVDFLTNNSIDPQTGNPHTAERIKSALEQAHINIKNAPIESQINDILLGISKIIPIKIETKKIKIRIPAVHTGKVYGIVNQYKEEEKWLDNGDLEVIVSVPAGIIIDFYDKLNGVTHGSAITEEIKEE
ncbi:MAG: ribosome assembly factor SBDS [Candidatus Pacearchaeota archaeon]|jgi:ribosome maturation protein SDO1|nr:ribosome assembly factor SBDS [Candidatus Pacearchaeota archaeon]MDP7520860.1 ribosome assembly factor SBDS [Candidatus Pacearchaeota archaeon]|tara:strand:+ start:1006 stop:1680 length:675 start_codon:yes stop_codon:yes gene_type:complete